MGDASRKEAVFGFSGTGAKVGAVAILLLSVTLVLFAIPEGQGPDRGPHELIRKLYYIPILLSASWFGARGAAASTAVATVACFGLIGGSWSADLGIQAGRLGEAGVFWLVGSLSASFFEQQRKHSHEVETANENTLVALASALDMREHNTGAHSLRVADYTVRLAEELGVRDRTFLEMLWKGALLHDVGKIGIPDGVLLKPGPLSGEEWEVMRRHSEIGSSMLRKISFLRESAEIVLFHHERFDGSGYPRGIAGEAIPLGARIFAVVDVYDALTTDRVYHGAASHEEGIRELREGTGTRYDPAVVSAFERISFEEWAAIARRNEPRPKPEPESKFLREPAAMASDAPSVE